MGWITTPVALHFYTMLARHTASDQLNNLRVIYMIYLGKISFATLNYSIPRIRDQKGSRQNPRDSRESPGIPRYRLLTGHDGSLGRFGVEGPPVAQLWYMTNYSIGPSRRLCIFPSFAFPCAPATPQSKSTSTCESHETCSTGDVEMTTASLSPSGGSPTSAVSLNSSVPSPQESARCTRHAHAPTSPAVCASARQRPSTAPDPVLLTLAGGLMAMRPRQMIEGHRLQLRQPEGIGSKVLPESDRKDSLRLMAC
jgi:hypothetical protein